VIQLAHDPLNMFHRFGKFISLIKKLTSQDWIVDLHNTLREGNSTVDCFDNLDAKSSKNLLLLDTTPPGLSSMLITCQLDS